MLEHEVGIPVGKHGIVAPAHHQHRLVDGIKNGVFRIFGSAPINQCFVLLIADGLPARRSRSTVRTLARSRNARPSAWLAAEEVKKRAKRVSGASLCERASFSTLSRCSSPPWGA